MSDDQISTVLLAFRMLALFILFWGSQILMAWWLITRVFMPRHWLGFGFVVCMVLHGVSILLFVRLERYVSGREPL